VNIKSVACVVVVLVLTACAQQPAKQLSGKAVERSLPSRWYDNTYLEYFDAYGAVRMIATGEQKLLFNEHGRLVSQATMDNLGDFEVRYTYHDDGRLNQINSFNSGGRYRLSEYIYDDNNALQEIRYEDFGSGQKFRSKHKTQPLASGWFSVDVPVEQIDLPLYKQFDEQQQLVWSSKSGFNHGPGRHFSLAVNDSVISAQILNAYTVQMHGIGGYGYEYDDQGRLWQIHSFNDNNHQVYHTTTYSYNEQGLLRAEEKVIVGESLFNDALTDQEKIQSVSYQYHNTDQYGNWTRRTVIADNGREKTSYKQIRQIEYFVPGSESR